MDPKLNAIKPSIREKKRYICFKAHTKANKDEISKKILSRIKLWIGEKQFALGRVHFMSKIFDDKNKTGIISCNHKQYLDTKHAITLVNEFKTEVFLASGSIKKAQEKIKEFNKK